MTVWSFLYLQNEVKDLINFNSSQTDQDFTTAQLKKAINRAYVREVNKAKQEGLQKYFHAYTDLTWLSGDVTFTVPDSIRHNALIKVEDVTTSDPGHKIVFDDNGFSGDVFWRDRNTLQWGTAGPSEDKTLRFEFYAEPTDMVSDDDEPDLVPPQHREIIVWSAGVDLRRRADEGSPQEWLAELHELRITYYKSMSLGKPFQDYPAIKNSYPDAEVGFVY